MSAKVRLTTFTDPMMGLSWEQEPVYRKLEARFGDQLEFRYRMVPLVPDVMRLVDPRDLQYGEAEAIRRYNARLAQIYLDEEPIGGVPIVMDGFSLFSEDERSTVGLCLAWEAASIVAPDASEAYLYALRYATIVEGRRTVRMGVALDVARECSIDADAMGRALCDGRAQCSLDADRAIAARLGIHALPTVLVSCEDCAELLNGLASYDAFATSIERLSEGRAHPTVPHACEEVLWHLIQRHPLVSEQELRAAFDYVSDSELSSHLLKLQAEGAVSVMDVKGSRFVKSSSNRTA